MRARVTMTRSPGRSNKGERLQRLAELASGCIVVAAGTETAVRPRTTLSGGDGDGCFPGPRPGATRRRGGRRGQGGVSSCWRGRGRERPPPQLRGLGSRPGIRHQRDSHVRHDHHRRHDDQARPDGVHEAQRAPRVLLDRLLPQVVHQHVRRSRPRAPLAPACALRQRPRAPARNAGSRSAAAHRASPRARTPRHSPSTQTVS